MKLLRSLHLFEINIDPTQNFIYEGYFNVQLRTSYATSKISCAVEKISLSKVSKSVLIIENIEFKKISK